MIQYLLSLIISFSLADSAFYRPSLAEFQETKKIALKLVEEYPENTHEIISIGRGLTVLVAFMKNLDVTNISTLPLSGMNTFEQVSDINKLNKVFSYFDATIPYQKKKELVFVDFSFAGKAYLAQKNLIEAYLRAYHPEIKFKFIALVSELSKNLIADFDRKSITTIKLTSKSEAPYGPLLWDSIYNNTYEDSSEFERFSPWIDQTPVSNPQFKEFKKLVKQEMMKDKDISCRRLL